MIDLWLIITGWLLCSFLTMFFWGWKMRRIDGGTILAQLLLGPVALLIVLIIWFSELEWRFDK